MDGPVAGSVTGTELHRGEQGGGKNCQFLEDTFFKQWYGKKYASFKKTMIFMQDNAPYHASKYSTAWLASKGLKDERIMTWPPSSPDLNRIENLWALLKWVIYGEGKPYTSLNSVWEAVVAAAQKVDHQQIKILKRKVAILVLTNVSS